MLGNNCFAVVCIYSVSSLLLVIAPSVRVFVEYVSITHATALNELVLCLLKPIADD